MSLSFKIEKANSSVLSANLASPALTEERKFAVRHYKCGSCGFTAKHKTWEFPFLPYGYNSPSELENGVKIYTEDGELIIEAPGEGKWALCSTSASAHLSFYWICRPFNPHPKDLCDRDFMESIST